MVNRILVGGVILVILVVAIAAIMATRQPAPPPEEETPTTSPTQTETTPAQTTPAETTPATEKPPEAKRVLRVGFAWPTYIDPAVGSDFSSTHAISNLYDPLVYPTPEGGVMPWVAESWEVSEDGRVWTFKIREGIKFHSGRELTAEDVAFSLKRMLTIGEGFSYLWAPYIDPDTGIKVIDEYTVQFILNKPFGPFLITLVRLYIVDQEEVMANIKTPGPYGEYGDFAKEWLLTNDAGSGPYKVKEVKLEEFIRMEKFEDYWAWKMGVIPPNPEAPDEIVFLALAVPPTERTLLLNRELEISSQWLPEEVLDALAKEEGISIAQVASGTGFYLMLNTKKPPLDDVYVRRALSYAFDYDTVIKQIYKGMPRMYGPVPPSVPGYCEVEGYEFNPEKAKEELSKSKYYPDIVNNPEKYVIEYHWVAEVPAEEKVALLFAKNVKEVLGLEVKVVKIPWLKAVEEMAKQETSPHIISIFVAPHYPEAGSLLESRYHSKSAASWEQNEWLLNETIDQMIEDALSTLDKDERFAKYCDIQKLVVKEAYSLFLFELISKFAYQSTYVYWPAAEGKAPIVMGYQIDGRFIKVFPEKRQELLGE
ncbi:MAG: ABC transporter substrate-binding protein [Desulfurococcales archaeon]|nr:ABC transporter substrate-binding protein [Desulfurococcales archaeon]